MIAALRNVSQHYNLSWVSILSFKKHSKYNLIGLWVTHSCFIINYATCMLQCKTSGIYSGLVSNNPFI